MLSPYIHAALAHERHQTLLVQAGGPTGVPGRRGLRPKGGRIMMPYDNYRALPDRAHEEPRGSSPRGRAGGPAGHPPASITVPLHHAAPGKTRRQAIPGRAPRRTGRHTQAEPGAKSSGRSGI